MKRLLLLAPLAAAAALVIATGACARRAPGPEECQRAAAIMLGIGSSGELRNPRAKAAFDKVVVECLTTPYDRMLVSCLEETGRTRACVVEYQARQRAGRAELLR